MERITVPTGTVQAIANGDQVALEHVVRLFQPRLRLYARRLTGNMHTAQDMVQEVFVRLWTRAHTIHGDSYLSQWLFHVTHNICVDELRWRAWRDLPAEPAELIQPQKSYVQPYSVLDRAEAQDILNRLCPGSRKVLDLRLKDFSYLEIADALRMPLNTVKSRLAHAHYRARKLRRELGYDETA